MSRIACRWLEYAIILSSSRKRKEIEMYNDLFDDFDYDSGQLDGYGYDPESGGYCYDGFVCPDASSMEEAEMEYWNTH